MEKSFYNYEEMEPIERMMYYNSLYLFLSQINIGSSEFAEKYSSMFNSDLSLKEGYGIVLCEVNYEIVGVLITADADETCEPYVQEEFRNLGIEEQLSDLAGIYAPKMIEKPQPVLELEWLDVC